MASPSPDTPPNRPLPAPQGAFRTTGPSPHAYAPAADVNGHFGDGTPHVQAAHQAYVAHGPTAYAPTYGPALHAPVQAPHDPTARRLPAPASPPPLFPDPPTPLETRWAFYERFDLLRRGRYIIGATVLAALMAGAALVVLDRPTYEAHSLLLVRSQNAVLDATAEFAPALSAEQRTLFNQALILQQAPGIAEGAARRLLSGGTPAVAAGLGPTPSPEALGRHLQTRVVRVEPEAAESNVIRITAAAPTAEEAARIAEYYTEEYVAFTRETSAAALTAVREMLEEQLSTRRTELASVEAEIERFEAATASVNLPQQAAARIGQVAQLEAALDRARVEQQLRGASLRSLETEMSTLQPHLRERLASGTDQEYARLNERIAALENNIETIYQRNPGLRYQAGENAQVAEMERQLMSLRAQRVALAERFVDEAVSSAGVDITNPQRGGDYITQLRQRIGDERVALAGTEAEMGALRQRLGQARGELGVLPERQMRLAQLRRQQEAAERSVLYLSERLDQTRLAEESGLGLAQIVKPATPPNRPSGMPHVATLGLALVLGLVAGVGGAAARHRFDGRLYAPRDLHLRGFGVLGVVPVLSEFARMAALHQPFSPAAESFRHLHAHLRRGAGGPRPQAVVVTGAERDAGASTVASNLAVAAAQSGLRTLLVDADLRRPSVRLRLGLSDEVGAGQNASPLVYWTTPVENLYALTAREAVEHPEGLWGQGTVRELLRHVRSAFDLIVFDAPPALLAADAAVIGSQTDAVVLVARAGQTHGDALAQAASELHDAGGELIGTVLTGFEPKLAHGYQTTFGYRHTASAR